MATAMASRLVRNMTRRTMTTMATPTENLSQQVATTTAPADPSLSFLPLRPNLPSPHHYLEQRNCTSTSTRIF